MSGNAALAAAKRRRNPAFAPEGGQIQHEHQEQPVQRVKSVVELLVEHDRKIFVLEKRMQIVREATGTDGNMTSPGNNSAAVANNAENLAKANGIELKLMKGTLTKQTKTLADLQSLITTLRATLNAQTAEITRLKQLKDDVDTLKKTANEKDNHDENEDDENGDDDEDDENEDDDEENDNKSKIQLKVKEK